MTFQSPKSSMPVQHLQVYQAEDFRVIQGVNEGEALGVADDLLLEDVYSLRPGARPRRLAIRYPEPREGLRRPDPQSPPAFRVGEDSQLGETGHPLHLDALLTFMAPHGETVEVLVLVETDTAGMIARTCLLPLAPLSEKTGYALVTIDRDQALARLAQTALVSFSRGTRITMADGRQVPVEKLRPGDRILTRDSGPQILRWIGRQTLRAVGAFAPITIAPGALNNTGPLTLSPNHRLFIYQRVDRLGTGSREVMVRAGNLVNGTSVVQSAGGFVEYFQLLFDKHEIIYAEGIASESLFVDMTTRPVVPEEVQARLKGDARPVEAGLELEAAELSRADAVELLRRASSC